MRPRGGRSPLGCELCIRRHTSGTPEVCLLGAGLGAAHHYRRRRVLVRHAAVHAARRTEPRARRQWRPAATAATAAAATAAAMARLQRLLLLAPLAPLLLLLLLQPLLVLLLLLPPLEQRPLAPHLLSVLLGPLTPRPR